jgi:hypothetical protein
VNGVLNGISELQQITALLANTCGGALPKYLSIGLYLSICFHGKHMQRAH